MHRGPWNLHKLNSTNISLLHYSSESLSIHLTPFLFPYSSARSFAFFQNKELRRTSAKAGRWPIRPAGEGRRRRAALQTLAQAHTHTHVVAQHGPRQPEAAWPRSTVAPATGTPAAVPTAVEEAGEETLGRHRKVERLKVWPAGQRRKRESEHTAATGAPPAAMAVGARRRRDGESRALWLRFVLAAQLVVA